MTINQSISQLINQYIQSTNNVRIQVLNRSLSLQAVTQHQRCRVYTPLSPEFQVNVFQCRTVERAVFS